MGRGPVSRDKVWVALAEAGVFSEPSTELDRLKDGEGLPVKEAAPEQDSFEEPASIEMEGWQAEDSFA